VRLLTTYENPARRLAAWLLSLPGPFVADSEEDALRLAHRAFDAGIPLAQFQAAFLEFGYHLLPENGKFRIASGLETPRRPPSVRPRIEIMHAAHGRVRTIAPQMC
jgi:hypothetical protein